VLPRVAGIEKWRVSKPHACIAVDVRFDSEIPSGRTAVGELNRAVLPGGGMGLVQRALTCESVYIDLGVFYGILAWIVVDRGLKDSHAYGSMGLNTGCL